MSYYAFNKDRVALTQSVCKPIANMYWDEKVM